MTDILTQVCQGGNPRVSVPWWMMTDNDKWQTVAEWKTVTELPTMGMTIMEDGRQLEIIDNGEWQYNLGNAR